MFSLRHQLQILQAVVGLIFVFVVNCLVRFKISTEMRLHYKAMLIDITWTASGWMIRAVERCIAHTVNPSLTFPIWIVCAEAAIGIGQLQRTTDSLRSNYINCHLSNLP